MREELRRSNEALRELYGVTTDTGLTFDEKLSRILEVGCDRFDLSYGFLTRIDVDDGAPGDVDGTQTIVEARGSHDLLQPGASCPLSEAYCRRTVRSDGLLGLYDATEDGWDTDPSYERFELGSYIGDKVVIDDDLYGTLCFADSEPRDRPFSDAERTVVRLMSRWTSYELERRRTTAELERQNDRLEEFAEVVSHDLRNPLNVLQGSIGLAEETGDSHYFANCRRAAERMQRLIDDLLTMARQGDAVADLEVVDLATLADDCWGTVDTPEATLEVSIETETTLWADPNRTRQILENLFRNAVEHGGERVSVRVGELDDGFYVEDDGPGIPPDERERVFESGYTTATDGTGFGLKIVEGVAEAHGWEVSVTEGPEGGARFEITGVEFL
jgi:signal transduction histidine kinase